MKKTLQPFKNTKELIRFYFKRDWIQLFAWTIILFTFIFGLAFLFPSMFSSAEQQQEFSQVMKNPAMTFIVGPGFGIDNYTLGAMYAHFMLLYSGVIVAILNVIFVSRYTRGDEEEGKLELIRALPVGHLAPLTSAIVVVVVMNIILGLLIGFGLSLTGIETMDLVGSLTFACSLSATGIFFMALTCLFAQITQSSRGTIGYTIGFLLVSYILRGAAEVQSSNIAWLSPLHWLIRSEAYVRNLWGPILLSIAAAVVVLLLSFRLYIERDLGAGLIPEKSGSTEAHKSLCSPFRLLLRLQKVPIIAWAIGLMAIGSSYGSIFGDMEKVLDIEMIKQILPDTLGYSIEEQFLSFIVIIVALISLIPTVLIVFHLKKEERTGRLDQLYSRPITRFKVYISYLSLSTVLSLLYLILVSFGMWGAIYSVMKDPISFSTIFLATLNPLPALLVMIGFAALLVGISPKLSNLFWVYYGYAFSTMYLGNMLDLPNWVVKLTPFGWLPAYPIESFKPLVIMSFVVISILLMALGYFGYQRRDLEIH